MESGSQQETTEYILSCLKDMGLRCSVFSFVDVFLFFLDRDEGVRVIHQHMVIDMSKHYMMVVLRRRNEREIREEYLK